MKRKFVQPPGFDFYKIVKASGRKVSDPAVVENILDQLITDAETWIKHCKKAKRVVQSQKKRNKELLLCLFEEFDGVNVDPFVESTRKNWQKFVDMK